MLVQWYPGHMAKARRMLIENLKLIDVVAEIVDARAPIATRNPDFDDLFKDKIRVVLLNKSDLSSETANRAWIEYYRSRGINAIEFVATKTSKKKTATALLESAAAEKVQRYKTRGVMKTVRIMVAGIPNVGKSTFINCLAGGVRAQVGDKPGVTKGKQWVKITPYLELMDTPGLLWPKLENERYAKHLAYIGSVNDNVLDTDELANELLKELAQICPDKLVQRYSGLNPESENLVEQVAQCRVFLIASGVYDIERAARVVLNEYRSGQIARIALEMPGETEDNAEEE